MTTINVPAPHLNHWRYRVYHCHICGKRTPPAKHRPPGWTSCIANRVTHKRFYYCAECAVQPSYTLQLTIHGQRFYLDTSGNTTRSHAAAQGLDLNQALQQAVKIIEMLRTDTVQVLLGNQIIFEKSKP